MIVIALSGAAVFAMHLADLQERVLRRAGDLRLTISGV